MGGDLRGFVAGVLNGVIGWAEDGGLIAGIAAGPSFVGRAVGRYRRGRLTADRGGGWAGMGRFGTGGGEDGAAEALRAAPDDAEVTHVGA